MTKQEYVKQIVRHLSCSEDKKADIERQLLSDIEIALNDGRKLEEILAEMGAPENVAAEFNENFGGEAGKRGKKKSRLIIILLTAAVILAALAGFVYWALPKTRDIDGSREFDAKQVEEYTQKVIEAFSRGDYDALEEYYSPQMKESVTRQMLEELKPVIGEDWGEYRGLSAAYMAEVSQRGRLYVITQVNASYENVSVTYTLTFDSDMQLVGFYMK